MSKHDLLCNELQVSKITNRESDTVSVDKPLQYSQTHAYDEYDLPPVWYIKQLLSGAGSASKTTIVAAGDLSIAWQIDKTSPAENAPTYAAKHGNSVGNIQGHYDAGGGLMTPYNPNYTYTLDGEGNIITLNITEVFAGTITII